MVVTVSIEAIGQLGCHYPVCRPSHIQQLNTTQRAISQSVKQTIKLCPRGAQTCALPQFCNCDLEINPVTLKLEGDLDILKMYLLTENEAASLRLSKRRA